MLASIAPKLSFLEKSSITFLVRAKWGFMLWWALGAATVYGQQIRVLDEATQLPIAGVRVAGNSAIMGAFWQAEPTNAEGTTLTPWLEQADSVRFSHPEFRTRTLSPFDLEALRYTVLLSEAAFSTEAVVVTADRSGEREDRVPQQLQLIEGRSIRLHNSPTPAHALEQHGMVYVQRSQLGGGSPVLRGFEASRVLLLADGVRLNNAIFRTGHLQNVLGVDVNLLNRMEVLFGPAALQYGTDALGGAIHLITREPELGREADPNLLTQALLRYGSAADEFTGHVDFNLGFEKFASLTSFSLTTFGDLRMGGWQNPFMGDFGLRKYYQAREGNQDTLLPNPDPRVQVGSGYTQMDLVQRLKWVPNARWQHSLNLQNSATGDVPRYDRLTDPNPADTLGIALAQAEWYYGPQTRTLASYRVQHRPASRWVDVVWAQATYQHFRESRHTRRFGSDWRTDRIEEVDALLFSAQAEKYLGTVLTDYEWGIPRRHKLYWGLEGIYNHVNSVAQGVNVIDDRTRPALTRYPDGGSQTQNLAAYVRHEWQPAEWLLLGSGVRYQWNSLYARFTENRTELTFLPPTVTQTHSATTGALSAQTKLPCGWQLWGTLASGFRTPNVDDLGKVFDSQPGQVVLPNPNVQPEYTLGAELGTRYTPTQNLRLEVVPHYTRVLGLLSTRPAQLNGQDSVLYDGTPSRVTQLDNVNEALIYGISGRLELALGRRFVLRQTLTYTYGRNLTEDAPLDHIPPIFGQTSLTYTRARLQCIGYVQYQGWKRIEDFSPTGEDNAQYALPQGSPAWFTLNLKAQYAVASFLWASVGLENLLDVHYRTFMSGISAPGRNLQVSLRFAL